MSDAMADGDAYTRVFAYPRVCKVLVEMADRFFSHFRGGS
jgi:hypothetical protein